ncbi:MAG TPA: hypothetical protein VHT03_09570 [Rhizomicrobium sp.]|jgi:hypothetical protein|nr:hypothetical protein [Rhizomicrobium sp.]
MADHASLRRIDEGDIMRKGRLFALAIATMTFNHAYADTLIKLVCATPGGDAYRFAFNMTRGTIWTEGHPTMKFTESKTNISFSNSDDFWSIDRSTLQLLDQRNALGSTVVAYVAQCQKDLPQM